MRVRRVALGAVLGGLVGFFWLSLSWTAFKLHDSSMYRFEDSAAVSTVLESNAKTPGVYVMPYPEAGAGASDSMEQTQKAGGAFMMGVVRADGKPDTSMGTQMAIGLATQIVAASLIAILLAAVAGNLNYLGRVMFVALAGLFAAIVGHVPNWNWWHFPNDHTIIHVADLVVGWLLSGLVMAAIIKPASFSASSSEPSAAAE